MRCPRLVTVGVTQTELVALVEGEAVVLVPRSAIMAHLRSIFAATADSMRDELIAERRMEAAPDDQRSSP
jgi:hypothetical protein